MNRPTADDVRSFYDARNDGKLRDFTHSNPRIEAAIKTLEEWLLSNPSGYRDWLWHWGDQLANGPSLARYSIVGADIRKNRYAYAQCCFNCQIWNTRLGCNSDSLHGKFDLLF